MKIIKTIQNCKIIKKALGEGEGLPKVYDGRCEGYQVSQTDDEPCGPCKRCKLNIFYDDGDNDGR